MPFKKKEAYEPVFERPEEGEQAAQSPDLKAPMGRPKTGVTKQRSDMESLYNVSGDVLDVWERRMVNPQGQSAPLIRISTPGMKLRWINLNNRGRYQRARYEQGWVPVEKGELVDEREIYGVSYTTEGFVCRGEKQQEMLMKIPTAVYKQIQKRIAEINAKSYKNLKANMITAGSAHVGKSAGDEGGDNFGSRAAAMAAEGASKFKGNVSWGTETMDGSDQGVDFAE